MESYDSRRFKMPLVVSLLVASASVFGIIAMLQGCRKQPADTGDSLGVNQEGYADIYHADNDIAMTVRSIADAMTVGERLDSAKYNYEGILTDGQGAPLYTDVEGSPGVWRVEVLDSLNARIRNVYLGDLLPDALRHYVASSLSLTDGDIVHNEHSDAGDVMTVYSLKGCLIRFEIHNAKTSDGKQGPLMCIVLHGKS